MGLRVSLGGRVGDGGDVDHGFVERGKHMDAGQPGTLCRTAA